MDEKDKKIEKTQTDTDLPAFEEEEKLGATMMDIDIDALDLDKGSPAPKTPQKPAHPAEEESVDDLLKKKKSILGKLGLKDIFGKK